MTTPPESNKHEIITDCCVHCRRLYATPACPQCGWESQRVRREEVLAER